MSKIWKLYRNELTKTSKKTIFLVLVIITFAAVFLLSGIAKLIYSLEDNYSETNETEIEYYHEYIDEEIEFAEQNLKDYEIRIDDTAEMVEAFCKEQGLTPASFALISKEEIEAAYNEIVVGDETLNVTQAIDDYRMGLLQKNHSEFEKLAYYDLGFVQGGLNDYVDTCIGELALSKTKKEFDDFCAKKTEKYPCYMAFVSIFVDCHNYDENMYGIKIPAEGLSSEQEKMLTEIITEKDYKKYIEYSIAKTKADKSLSDYEKKITLESYDVLLDAYGKGISFDQWSQMGYAISDVTSKKIALYNGVDESGIPLTEEAKENLELTIKEIELSIRNKACGYGSEVSTDVLFGNELILSVAIGIARVMIIVLGALLIAEEMQTGSIKMLIISPVKRSKIFTAKLMLLVTATLFEYLLIYITFIFSNLIFRIGAPVMTFTLNGTAHVMNFYVYMFVAIGLEMFSVFVYGVFALMLSTLFRSVAPSLAITFVFAYVLESFTSIVRILLPGQKSQMLFRFIPSENITLRPRFFVKLAENSMDLIGVMFNQSGTGISGFNFAFIYDIVLIAVMLFIAYQSFIKRDIK